MSAREAAARQRSRESPLRLLLRGLRRLRRLGGLILIRRWRGGALARDLLLRRRTGRRRRRLGLGLAIDFASRRLGRRSGGCRRLLGLLRFRGLGGFRRL